MTKVLESEAACTGLCIATPAHGGFTLVPYQHSLRDTEAYLRTKWNLNIETLVQPSDSCITRARSALAHAFLRRTKASHFMFIDADLEWEPPAVERLIASGFDVCCGAYPFKRFPTEFVFHFDHDPDEPIPTCPRTGYWRIRNATTGFLMITRRALERMCEAYPETQADVFDGKDTVKDLHFLFDNSLEDRQYWTEDYTFCRRWRAIGGEVWLDPHIHLKHWGLHAFDAGKPADHIRPAVAVDTLSAAA
jgi:hypothetical protein